MSPTFTFLYGVGIKNAHLFAEEKRLLEDAYKEFDQRTLDIVGLNKELKEKVLRLDDESLDCLVVENKKVALNLIFESIPKFFTAFIPNNESASVLNLMKACGHTPYVVPLLNEYTFDESFVHENITSYSFMYLSQPNALSGVYDKGLIDRMVHLFKEAHGILILDLSDAVHLYELSPNEPRVAYREENLDKILFDYMRDRVEYHKSGLCLLLKLPTEHLTCLFQDVSLVVANKERINELRKRYTLKYHGYDPFKLNTLLYFLVNHAKSYLNSLHTLNRLLLGYVDAFLENLRDFVLTPAADLVRGHSFLVSTLNKNPFDVVIQINTLTLLMAETAFIEESEYKVMSLMAIPKAYLDGVSYVAEVKKARELITS